MPASTPPKRRRRAPRSLDELIRVGGFERSTLLIVMPTGTGWIDPEGIDTVEYLHHGDIASVAIQYSYLASWLSLLAEPWIMARRRRARSSAPSTATGRACPGKAARNSISTVSASARCPRNSRPSFSR